VPLSSVMPALDEAEVRRLCGPARYARATALQATGHVVRPRRSDLMWSAEVRGTWRRMDRAQVETDGSQLVASCSCGTPGFCSHAGALLLQWLRAPDTFERVPGTPSADSSSSLPAQPETPQTELLHALQKHTLEHVRDIARRRRVRLTARTKADVAAQLATGLAEPANLDTALAELRREELLALRATCLVADGTLSSSAIQAGYEWSGGSGTVPLEALVELGLVVAEGRDLYSSFSFKVPRVVAARVPVWPDLVRAAKVVTPEVPGAGATGLGIVELLAVLCHAVRDGLAGPPPASGDAAGAGSLPSGWGIDPADARELPRGAMASRGLEVTLVPVAPLQDEDLARLAARTGQSTWAVGFGLHLLVALGLVRGAQRLELDEERWQAFLAAAADERAARLCRAWLETTSWSELALVAGAGGPFQVRGPLGSSVGRAPLLVSHVAALRRLSARCVGLLAPNIWYDPASFTATIDSLAKLALPERSTDYWSHETLDKLAWGLVDRRHPRQPLALRRPEDRARVYGTLVAALLEGPLAWLGLVEVATDRDGPRAFRVRPAAGVLMGRPIGQPPSPATVIVGDDASVLVSSGTADASVHSLLARVGELAGGSAEGLRYTLTAERVQAAFDNGLSGPELVRFLEERSSKRVPRRVRSRIERWWASYGSVRLYDELSLVELSQEILPAEVLAAVPALRKHLVYAISPRLLAVEPTAADAVVAELVRLGYAPRIVEGGAGV
jgi:hypothetical protein